MKGLIRFTLFTLIQAFLDIAHRIGGNPEPKIRLTNAEQFNNKQSFRLPKTIIWQSKMIMPHSLTVILGQDF